MSKPLFSIGADPEVFAMDFNAELRSVIGKIGGSKEHPNFWEYPGFALQEDNVAVEFNIPACFSKHSFINAINKSLNKIEQTLNQHKLTISTKCAHSFLDEELSDPMSWVFGCEPDYNAWTESKNPKPNAPDPNLRTAGGHIHIGTKIDPVLMTKTLDLTLAAPSLFLDKDNTRKELYGKAGAFRPGKSYNGLEYRVLSNFWIFNQDYISWVYDQIENTIRFLSKKSKVGFENKLYHNTERINNFINRFHTRNLDYNKCYFQELCNIFNTPNNVLISFPENHNEVNLAI